MKPYEGALQKVRYGESLSRQEVKESLLALYRDHDQTNASMQMGMLLYGTAVRGTQVDEILGLADFLCDVEPHLLGNLPRRSLYLAMVHSPASALLFCEHSFLLPSSSLRARMNPTLEFFHRLIRQLFYQRRRRTRWRQI